MVLDYAKDCGFCREPLAGPPRVEAGGLCAHNHSDQGLKEFQEILRNKRRDKEALDG